MKTFVCVVVLLNALVSGRQGCGRSKILSQLEDGEGIFGGSEAVAGSWPWHVELHNGQQSCVGTLIDDLHVITTGSCLSSRKVKPEMLRVQLGSHMRDTRENAEVAAKVLHTCEGQSWFKPGNDFGILRLEAKVNFTDVIQPICLPKGSSELPDKTALYATGSDHTSAGGLCQARTESITDFRCGRDFQIAAHNTICTTDDNDYSCRSDEGGPLMRVVGGVWFLEGVFNNQLNSHRKPGSPKRYTKVSRYIDFINGYRSLETVAELKKYCFN
uniref:Putative tick serine proteinase n=2 Tax=Ixodes ricinus TaxID=34613 RepID=V5H7N8_IXORI